MVQSEVIIEKTLLYGCVAPSPSARTNTATPVDFATDFSIELVPVSPERSRAQGAQTDAPHDRGELAGCCCCCCAAAAERDASAGVVA